ncbi:hypothetical protein KCP74_18370 [Salmonella enterica subsp. enterica]|nr:hypothetical protein KCP74_18370 [Salmonella enterica subsp. enterica]
MPNAYSSYSLPLSLLLSITSETHRHEAVRRECLPHLIQRVIDCVSFLLRQAGEHLQTGSLYRLFCDDPPALWVAVAMLVWVDINAHIAFNITCRCVKSKSIFCVSVKEGLSQTRRILRACWRWIESRLSASALPAAMMPAVSPRFPPAC